VNKALRTGSAVVTAEKKIGAGGNAAAKSAAGMPALAARKVRAPRPRPVARRELTRTRAEKARRRR